MVALRRVMRTERMIMSHRRSLRKRQCGQAAGFLRHGCHFQRRGPIWVEDGINKKHTAGTHRGRFLSFVRPACSVHNRVGLVGKRKRSAEQDRHRYCNSLSAGLSSPLWGGAAVAHGGAACSCVVFHLRVCRTLSHTARLSAYPAVSATPSQSPSSEYARSKTHKLHGANKSDST